MTAKLKDILHATLGKPIRKAGASGVKTATARNALNGLKLDYLLNGLYFQTLGNSLIDLVRPPPLFPLFPPPPTTPLLRRASLSVPLLMSKP